MLKRISFTAVAFLAAAFSLHAQNETKPDPFQSIRFIVGRWTGISSGQPGNGKGERTYQFVLGERYLRSSNKIVYPPQEKNKKGETHQDFGVFSYDKARKALVLRQFHVEGFVNIYVQETPTDPKRLVFTTEAIENIPPGWRARETYQVVSDNEFVERFELAEPGKDFELYSESRWKRVR